MKILPQKREGNSILPAPVNGAVPELNPPSLQWVAEPGVKEYRVVVTGENGEVVADETVVRNVFRFRSSLKPGLYSWNVFTEEGERGAWVFTVPEYAIEFRIPSAAELLDALPAERPRHIYYQEDLAALAASHPVQLAILERNKLLALAEGMMCYPDFYRPDGRCDYRTALDEVRRFLDRNMVGCALLYLFKGDREAGEYAKRALLTVCEWNPAGPASVAGEWGDEIGLSICRTFPAVFDWIYDLLTPKERSWAVQTLHQHARQVYGLLERGRFFEQPGQSHSGRLPGYLGEMALVLHGEISRGECEKFLSYALDLYGTLFPHYGGDDGGWAEGPFYASSYTKWYLPFFLAVERVSGFSFLLKPFFRHVAEFFTHFAAPDMDAHPFGDGHWETRVEWPGFQAQNPFTIYAERFGPDKAREFSRRCDEQIEHYELHLFDVIRPAPRAALPPGSRVGTDRSYVSYDTGLAALHAGDISLFLRCSRYGTPSHQHADQGDFALLAGGEGLLLPTGSFGYQFGTDHHTSWTQQTVAANCLLFGGAGQPKNSADATGRMECELERDDRSRIVMHLEDAYPMVEHYTRTVEFDHATGSFTVTDEAECREETEADFRLHSNLRPETEGKLISIRGKRGTVTFEAPAAAEFSLGDRYIYPNGAEGGSVPGRNRAPQFHMNWRFPKRKKFTIRFTFQVELSGGAGYIPDKPAGEGIC